MCHCHRCKKRKSRRFEKSSNKFTSKVSVNVKITNQPKNINKNELINFDPDFTQAYAGSGFLPTVTP